jgi:hypothetical protein
MLRGASSEVAMKAGSAVFRRCGTDNAAEECLIADLATGAKAAASKKRDDAATNEAAASLENIIVDGFPAASGECCGWAKYLMSHQCYELHCVPREIWCVVGLRRVMKEEGCQLSIFI